MEEKSNILNKSDKSLEGENVVEQNQSILSKSENKVGLEQQRIYKSQNQILKKQISELTDVCFGLKDNIITSKERLEDIKAELVTRKIQRQTQFDQLTKIRDDPSGKEAGDYLLKKKEELVLKHLNDIINHKIPELNTSSNQDSNQEQYNNLMYEHVDITFCDYAKAEENIAANFQMIGSNLNNNNNINNNNNNNNIDDNLNTNVHLMANNYNSNYQNNNNININNNNNLRNKKLASGGGLAANQEINMQNLGMKKKTTYLKQAFRISSKTTFLDLKEIACEFFHVTDNKNYLITDEAESIFIDEESNVNEYLSEFSVFSNNFKLVSLSVLKSRTELIKVQKDKIKTENNKLLDSLGRGNQGGSAAESSGHDSSLGKINSFFNDYFGLTPYILHEGEEKSEKDRKAAKNSSIFTSSLVTSIDTSFVMMIVLVFYYIFTVVFIYSSRDIGRNNLKIKFLSNFFDNSNTTDYRGLYKFFINKVAKRFSKNEFPNNTSVNHDSYVEAFEILGYQNFTKTTKNSDKIIDYNAFVNGVNIDRKNHIQFFFASSFHLILNKVHEKECSRTQFANSLKITDTKCYHEFYNDDTALKSDLNIQQFGDDKQDIDNKNLFQDLQKYKTASEANIFLDVIKLFALIPMLKIVYLCNH